jgi:hypothetical protein
MLLPIAGLIASTIKGGASIWDYYQRKPKYYTPNTGGYDKALEQTYKRMGRLPGEMNREVMPFLRGIGESENLLHEKIDFDSRNGANLGSGVEIQGHLSTMQKANEGRFKISENAEQRMGQERSRLSDVADDLSFKREQLIKESERRHEIAVDNWEKGKFGAWVNGLSPVVEGGLNLVAGGIDKQMAMDKAWDDASKQFGLPAEDLKAMGRTPEEALKQYAGEFTNNIAKFKSLGYNDEDILNHYKDEIDIMDRIKPGYSSQFYDNGSNSVTVVSYDENGSKITRQGNRITKVEQAKPASPNQDPTWHPDPENPGMERKQIYDPKTEKWYMTDETRFAKEGLRWIKEGDQEVAWALNPKTGNYTKTEETRPIDKDNTNIYPRQKVKDPETGKTTWFEFDSQTGEYRDTGIEVPVADQRAEERKEQEYKDTELKTQKQKEIEQYEAIKSQKIYNSRLSYYKSKKLGDVSILDKIKAPEAVDKKSFDSILSGINEYVLTLSDTDVTMLASQDEQLQSLLLNGTKKDVRDRIRTLLINDFSKYADHNFNIGSDFMLEQGD